MTSLFAGFVFCALAVLTVMSSTVSAAPNPDVQTVSAAGSDFGFRLLQMLATDQTKAPDANVFFSPFSVSQALTLTMNGAGGQTQAEMAKTLGMEALTQAQINAANVQLLPALTSDPKVQVSIANALWASTGQTFSPAFEDEAKTFYHAQATTLDFHAPMAAAAINTWVRKNTMGRITQIVSANDLASFTKLLTNAVYFHGQWQTPFEKMNTEMQPFHLPGGSTKPVPLMKQCSEIAYLDTPQFQVAVLPYGTGRMSLIVFLPKPDVSVETVALTMTGDTAAQWLGAMQPTVVLLYLPRFKAATEQKLREPLSTLGMSLAFDNAADFDRMGSRQTKLGEVLHIATLDVDEQGTTAAATTGVFAAAGGAPAAPPPLPPVMRVDRPFIVLIRDTETGTLLFAGVIRNPQ